MNQIMIKNCIKLFPIFLLVVTILFVDSASAQNDDELDELFTNAWELFSKGEYKIAIKIFDEILETEPTNSKIFDVIYDPDPTLLLTYAREHKLDVLNGLNMNLEQAVLAYAKVNKMNDKLKIIKDYMMSAIK